MSLLASVQQPNLSNFYFALAGDPSLNNANWASFPATTTINASGNAIDNALSIEIDGYVLTAGPNELLLDGVPLVTTTNLSSIADWSLYESLSGGVDMAGYTIKNISGLNFLGGNLLRASGGKALVNGLDVVRVWSQCNALTDINAGGHNITNVGFGLGTIQTGGTDNLLVNGIDVVSKWSDYIAESNVNMNGKAIQNANQVDCDVLTIDGQTVTATPTDIYINGLSVGGEWSTLPAISDVSMARNSIQDLSSIDFYYGPGASVVLNASGGFLYANGTKLATGGSVNEWSLYAAARDVSMNQFKLNDVNAINFNPGAVALNASAGVLYANGVALATGSPASNWSTFPAVSDVNIANRNIGGAKSLTVSNFIGSNGIRSTGATNLYGDLNLFSLAGNTTPSFSFDRSQSPSKITGISDLKMSGNSNWLNGNCNILGATTYASSNYLYGGTTIDGGLVRGCSIGCLPEPVFPYINTNRIDVLPVGIDVTSATYLSMNIFGAGNWATGGAMALAAGGYMTLEHGFIGLSNGIYVQDTARDDAARMIFEFGGSVGNSIDTPTRSGNMDFHGTRFYVGNMYASARGNRYPRLPYLNIYDISQLSFYSGASIRGDISGSGNLTLSGNVIFSNATFNGLTMNGNINMSGNAISNCTLLDMCAGFISNVQVITSVNARIDNVAAFTLYTSNILLNPDSGGTAINVYAPTRFSVGVSGGGIFTDSIGIVQTGRTEIDVSGGFHFVNSSVSGSYITGGTGGTEISGGLAITGAVSVSSGNLNMGGNSITNCSNITVGRITDLNFITSTTGINISANIVGFNGDIAVSATADVSDLYVHNNSRLNTITGTPTLVGTNLAMGGNSITNCSNITVGRITNLDFITSTTGINVSAAIVDFLGDVASKTLYVASNADLNTIIGTPTLSGVDLNFNGRTGTNVISPILPSNVANKDYVDKHNPVTYTEATTPINVFSTTPVALASATIVLTATSRIWAVATTTYDNVGSGSADYIVSSFLVINGVTYGTTRTSIPARFSPSVPSSTSVVVQAVIPTALGPGSYVATIYASANVANTDLTADHSDLVTTGGLF